MTSTAVTQIGAKLVDGLIEKGFEFINGLINKPKTVYVDNPELKRRIDELNAQNEQIAERMRQADGNVEQLQSQLLNNNACIAELQRQNDAMNTYINELNGQMTTLQERAARDERKYNDIKEFCDGFRAIRYLDSVALIGPKGSGKSTFLWLMGISQKPTASFGDGTTTMINLSAFVDTIGINIELRSVLKMMAIFLVRGVPNSLIVFSNDRVVRDALVLSYLGLRQLMFVMISPEAVYEGDAPSRFYRRRRMDELLQHDPTITCLTHEDMNGVVPTNGNLLNAFKHLFPADHATLVDFSTFESDEENRLINTLRYQVCSLARDFLVIFHGNELAFLNEVA